MSISRAYKDIIEERNTPEFTEYMTAIFKYKDEFKRWKQIKRLKLNLSENPLERLQHFEAQERFKRECRIYAAAKDKYESFRIKKRLGNMSIEKIASMLDIVIPTSMEDLIREAKTIAPIVTMTDEQSEIIKAELLKNAQKSESTKEQFLTKTEVNESTQDYQGINPFRDEDEE